MRHLVILTLFAAILSLACANAPVTAPTPSPNDLDYAAILEEWNIDSTSRSVRDMEAAHCDLQKQLGFPGETLTDHPDYDAVADTTTDLVHEKYQNNEDDEKDHTLALRAMWNAYPEPDDIRAFCAKQETS